MKFQILNDLHVDYPGSRGFPPPAPGVEIVIVAGDTCQGLVRSIALLRRAYPSPIEIVMVAGNHELWSRHLAFEEHFDEGHDAAELHGVHLLENGTVTINGVLIAGATLWTDYELFGADLREAAMQTAADAMLDHKRIKWCRDPWARFRPTEARMLHHRSRMFFEGLEEFHSGPSVWVSHHAMSMDAIAPVQQRSILSAAYASELLPMIDRLQPDLIVSGHTHHGIDVRRGRTRMVSNPAGYADENPRFDPSLVVDLGG